MNFELSIKKNLTLSQLYKSEVNSNMKPILQFDSDRRSTLSGSPKFNDQLKFSQQFQQIHTNYESCNVVSLYYQQQHLGIAYKFLNEVTMTFIQQSQIGSIRQFLINQEITNISLIHNAELPQILLSQIQQLLKSICQVKIFSHNDYNYDLKTDINIHLLNQAQIDPHTMIQLNAALPIWDDFVSETIQEQIIGNQIGSKLQFNEQLLHHLAIIKSEGKQLSIQQFFEKYLNSPVTKKILQNALANPINSYSLLQKRYSQLSQIYSFLLQPQNVKFIKLCNKVGSFQLILKILSNYPNKTDPYQKFYQQLLTLNELLTMIKQMSIIDKRQLTQSCQLFKDILKINYDPILDLIELFESSLQFNQSTIQIKEGKYPQLDQLNKLNEQLSHRIQLITTKHQSELTLLGIKSQIKIVFQDGYEIQLEFKNDLQLDTIQNQLPNWIFQRVDQKYGFFKSELTKQLEQVYGHLEEDILIMQQKTLISIVKEIQTQESLLKELEETIGHLDYNFGLSQMMTQLKLVIPNINNSDYIDIKQGRHMLVESNTQKYQANNFSAGENRIFLIEGPNYSGKSIFIRSVGIIVYLAHCGLPVPAEQADICVLQSIYTLFPCENCRDNNLTITNNELLELSECLKQSNRSLILMDEIGKNFKYQMGSNLHKTTLEYFYRVSPVPPYVLSATHFQNHEFYQLPGIMKGEMEVYFEENRNLIFVYKIKFEKEPKKQSSYGLQVALNIHQNEELYQRGQQLYEMLIKYKQLN